MSDDRQVSPKPMIITMLLMTIIIIIIIIKKIIIIKTITLITTTTTKTQVYRFNLSVLMTHTISTIQCYICGILIFLPSPLQTPYYI